jgi:hypothetical protein
VAVPSGVRNQTCPHVDIILRRIINVQTELNGNMLFLHMHLESHSLNGRLDTVSLLRRMRRSLKEGKCTEKMNKVYRRIKADMYNLYPTIGEVNGRGSNYSMAIIEGEKMEFGQCDVEIKSRK